MTMPTEEQLAIATRMGRRAAELGRSVLSCPYRLTGPNAQPALARRFVHAYNGAKDPTVSFADDPAPDGA